MNSVSSPFPFLGLPNELWVNITNIMDIPTRVKFSQTCKWASGLVNDLFVRNLFVKQIGIKVDNLPKNGYALKDIYGISRIVQIYRKVFPNQPVGGKNFQDIKDKICSDNFNILARTELTVPDYKFLLKNGCSVKDSDYSNYLCNAFNGKNFDYDYFLNLYNNNSSCRLEKASIVKIIQVLHSPDMTISGNKSAGETAIQLIDFCEDKAGVFHHGELRDFADHHIPDNAMVHLLQNRIDEIKNDSTLIDKLKTNYPNSPEVQKILKSVKYKLMIDTIKNIADFAVNVICVFGIFLAIASFAIALGVGIAFLISLLPEWAQDIAILALYIISAPL